MLFVFLSFSFPLQNVRDNYLNHSVFSNGPNERRGGKRSATFGVLTRTRLVRFALPLIIRHFEATGQWMVAIVPTKVKALHRGWLAWQARRETFLAAGVCEWSFVPRLGHAAYAVLQHCSSTLSFQCDLIRYDDMIRFRFFFVMWHVTDSMSMSMSMSVLGSLKCKVLSSNLN